MLTSAVLLSSTVNAATQNYIFGDLYKPKENSGYPTPTNFASLSVSTGHLWTFRVEVYDLEKYFGDSSFFGGLVTQSSDETVEVKEVKSGSGVNVKYKSSGMIYNGTDSGGFSFDFGKGQDRLLDGEWVQWTATGVSSILGYAAHIQGINIGGFNDDSAWYEAKPAPVPLPASFWLLGSVLLGLSAVKKYIKIKTKRIDASAVTT